MKTQLRPDCTFSGLRSHPSQWDWSFTTDGYHETSKAQAVASPAQKLGALLIKEHDRADVEEEAQSVCKFVWLYLSCWRDSLENSSTVFTLLRTVSIFVRKISSHRSIERISFFRINTRQYFVRTAVTLSIADIVGEVQTAGTFLLQRHALHRRRRLPSP